MKILIATDQNSLESRVAKRFGRANYYIKIDAKTNIRETISVEEGKEHHEIIPALAKDGVSIVIAENVGPKAFNLLQEHNIKFASAKNMTAEEAFEKAIKGQLKYIEEPTIKSSIGQKGILPS
jgi:predicted Fe-Mo cluster-binding NifX family protein